VGQLSSLFKSGLSLLPFITRDITITYKLG